MKHCFATIGYQLDEKLYEYVVNQVDDRVSMILFIQLWDALGSFRIRRNSWVSHHDISHMP